MTWHKVTKKKKRKTGLFASLVWYLCRLIHSHNSVGLLNPHTAAATNYHSCDFALSCYTLVSIRLHCIAACHITDNQSRDSSSQPVRLFLSSRLRCSPANQLKYMLHYVHHVLVLLSITSVALIQLARAHYSLIPFDVASFFYSTAYCCTRRCLAPPLITLSSSTTSSS